MDVDIGNALASVATPGISRTDLEALDEQVGTAHERIERGRADGEHGYAALDLPFRTDPTPIEAATDAIGDAETLVTVGIGGSSLGAATIVDALAPDAPVHVLDNVDPEWVRRRLAAIPLEDAAVHVVSRSGTTAETMANFLVVRAALEDAGVDWTRRTLVTTGDEGPLRSMADEHDLATLAVPSGVPGRYSALSSMGLVAGAFAGVDIDAVLTGGRAEAETLADSLFDCPAYAYGAVSYALAHQGAAISAMMPYVESLETFAEWYAQLWAESLGKEGFGQTPARALGVTDQHSQLQLYRAGPRDKLVTFVTTREGPEVTIPTSDDPALSYLTDATLGSLLEAECRATEASLAAAGRPSVRVELESIDAYELGGLLYAMEAACVLVAELQGIDAFDQPAVEWGKEAARSMLAGAETVDETDPLWIRR